MRSRYMALQKRSMKTHSIRRKTEVNPSICAVFVHSLITYRLYGAGLLDKFVLRFQGAAGWREYDLKCRRKATREQHRRYYGTEYLHGY